VDPDHTYMFTESPINKTHQKLITQKDEEEDGEKRIELKEVHHEKDEDDEMRKTKWMGDIKLNP